MHWLLWGLILFAQNFSFTLMSRARNSDSLAFNASCSVLSNTTYILAQILMFGNMFVAFQSSDYGLMAKVGLFYITFTTIGSIASHYLAMHYIERFFKVGGR